MNANTFATEIVIPTVKEALKDRGSRRRQYVACIVTYSLIEYIVQDATIPKDAVISALRNVCSPALDVVQGVCNGTKHAGSTGKFMFTPGQDRNVPVFAFNVPGAGWGQGRWNVPGLVVTKEGTELFLDTCVQVVLLTLSKLYPTELGNVNLSFLDAMLIRPTTADTP